MYALLSRWNVQLNLNYVSFIGKFGIEFFYYYFLIHDAKFPFFLNQFNKILIWVEKSISKVSKQDVSFLKLQNYNNVPTCIFFVLHTCINLNLIFQRWQHIPVHFIIVYLTVQKEYNIIEPAVKISNSFQFYLKRN